MYFFFKKNYENWQNSIIFYYFFKSPRAILRIYVSYNCMFLNFDFFHFCRRFVLFRWGGIFPKCWKLTPPKNNKSPTKMKKIKIQKYTIVGNIYWKNRTRGFKQIIKDNWILSIFVFFFLKYIWTPKIGYFCCFGPIYVNFLKKLFISSWKLF